MIPQAQTNKAPAEYMAKAFKEVDWPIPPYLMVGFLNRLAHDITIAHPAHKMEIMYQAIRHTYNPLYIATMFLERYSTVIHVRDFREHIDQAIKAYFSGYKLPSICALIPVIEGIIRKRAAKHGRDLGNGTIKFKLEFSDLVEKEKNSSHCYGERLVMLEALRDFMEKRFLEKTDNYDGMNQFNRHGILHGLYDNFGDDKNFYRLITLLDLLCFLVGLEEGGSCFAPEDTPESVSLGAHYLQLSQASFKGEII